MLTMMSLFEVTVNRNVYWDRTNNTSLVLLTDLTTVIAELCSCNVKWEDVNPLTPKDHYSVRTAPLTSKRCILYIYSTNTGTEYFKHGIYCPFFSSSKRSLFHNSNVFGSCIIHILYTGCAKIKKIFIQQI